MRYAFGECQLDAARRSLTRAGRERSLQPKVLNLLILLVQHRGRVASRQLLFQELRPDVAVSEASLTRRVTEARRAVVRVGVRELAEECQAAIRTARARSTATPSARSTESPAARSGSPCRLRWLARGRK